VTIIHARSIAENIVIFEKNNPFSGKLEVNTGQFVNLPGSLKIEGESLVHSAQLTTIAFTRSFFGKWGKYIVAIGIMLFAFSLISIGTFR
ncbi:MAG: amino acid carrier protein, partial [Candidatus Uhrbacteria bacterium GW2011_GWE2_40_58]